MKNRNEDNAENTTEQVFIKNFYKKTERITLLQSIKSF